MRVHSVKFTIQNEKTETAEHLATHGGISAIDSNDLVIGFDSEAITLITLFLRVVAAHNIILGIFEIDVEDSIIVIVG